MLNFVCFILLPIIFFLAIILLGKDKIGLLIYPTGFVFIVLTIGAFSFSFLAPWLYLLWILSGFCFLGSCLMYKENCENGKYIE